MHTRQTRRLVGLDARIHEGRPPGRRYQHVTEHRPDTRLDDTEHALIDRLIPGTHQGGVTQPTLVTGLPKTVTVSSEETEEALKEPTLQIVEAVHSVLEKTPPELAADVADRGIVLTGGGSLLRGLEELIEDKTGINTMIAEDPLTAVAIGTGKFIEFTHDGGKSEF
mgnify:CR=1 FL=1